MQKKEVEEILSEIREIKARFEDYMQILTDKLLLVENACKCDQFEQKAEQLAKDTKAAPKKVAKESAKAGHCDQCGDLKSTTCKTCGGSIYWHTSISGSKYPCSSLTHNDFHSKVCKK